MRELSRASPWAQWELAHAGVRRVLDEPFAVMTERGDSLTTGIFRKVSVGVVCLALIPSVHAATCPFDGGGSAAVNDSIVLTRYALGITGAPLVASTRYASLDPLQVKNNIECVGCALDMNGDNAIDTVDTTIIARHLAGFSGASLTNGLALGSGTRSTPASVQSFLASGCAVGGAINAFVQGGNSFGVPALLGTNDIQPLTLRSQGDSANLTLGNLGGLRITRDGTFNISPNMLGGSGANAARPNGVGNVVGGGGDQTTTCFSPSTLSSSASCANRAWGDFSTIGGGLANFAGAIGPDDRGGTIGGGISNEVYNGTATIGGGFGNLARGVGSTIIGGSENKALGDHATVLGGFANRAGAELSVAAGFRSIVRNPTESGTPVGDIGTFIWADTSDFVNDFVSSGENQFNIRAKGGVRLHNSTSQFFGNQTRQMLNLWGTEYGIGVQSNTLYYRSGAQFSWFIGGEHCDLPNCPYPSGGTVGTENMRLTSSQLLVNGTFVQGSDRGIKENFATVNPKSILAKVASLPISLWNYKADDNKTQHVGPMAQDFKRLFGVGQDDKTIATVDASGVALAAIQGLHALVKEKDAEIARLKEKAKRVDSLERDLAAVMKRLGMK